MGSLHGPNRELRIRPSGSQGVRTGREVGAQIFSVYSGNPDHHFFSGAIPKAQVDSIGGVGVTAIFAGQTQGGEIESYLHFNEPQTAKNIGFLSTVVTTAGFFLSGSTYRSATFGARLFMVTEDWTPSTITWNTKPSVGTPTWNFSGAFLDKHIGAVSAGGWFIIDDEDTGVLDQNPDTIYYGMALASTSSFEDHGLPTDAVEPYASWGNFMMLVLD